MKVSLLDLHRQDLEVARKKNLYIIEDTCRA